MDKTILDLSRQKIEYADLGQHPARATRRRCCSSPSPATTRTSSPHRLDRLTELWARQRPRLPHAARGHARPAGGAAQGAQGQPRPADGQLGRHPPAAGVRRGHRRRPEHLARVHRSASARCSTGTASRPASTATPRWAACTSGRSSTSPSPAQVAAHAGGRGRGQGPGPRVRRGQLQRARRRPGAQRVQPRASSATTSTRRCARSRALFDPRRRDEPRQDRRRARR